MRLFSAWIALVSLQAAPLLVPTQLVIGDALPAVQQALHTTEPAIDSKGGDVEVGSELHLPERGIWVFFDGMNLARQYRFDAPFAGEIHGARLGASIDQVRKALGAPVRDITYTVSFGKAYLYRPDGGTTIRCDFDPKHKLTTIRVLGGAVTFSEPAAAPTP